MAGSMASTVNGPASCIHPLGLEAPQGLKLHRNLPPQHYWHLYTFHRATYNFAIQQM